MRKLFTLTALVCALVFPVPAQAGYHYRQWWEVTYYVQSGRMADGRWTYVGAAACGGDVRLGARVYVPGVGLLRCEDRVGFNGWRHVDVFGWRPGLGNDRRLVTVYP